MALEVRMDVRNNLFSLEGSAGLEQGTQRGGGISIPESFQDLTKQNHG